MTKDSMTKDNGRNVRKSWTVTVSIDEHGTRTRAKARLHWRDQVLVGVGFARRHPADRPVNEIGDELAVARALSDLAGRLTDLTAHDIQVVTNQPVTDLH